MESLHAHTLTINLMCPRGMNAPLREALMYFNMTMEQYINLLTRFQATIHEVTLNAVVLNEVTLNAAAAAAQQQPPAGPSAAPAAAAAPQAPLWQ